MPYRVDYLVALLAAGAFVGWLLGQRARRPDTARVARLYLIASVIAIAGRVLATFDYAVFGITPFSVVVWGIARDLCSVVFGALFGLAVSRGIRGHGLLRERDVLTALCLSTGAWFVVGGLASSFVFDSMAEFFKMSGYAPAFLRVIIAVEVVGGMALLVPWVMPFGLAGLALDMFGAIYTHAHNADGIHADMDAIAMVLRLATIAALWLCAQRPERPVRRALAIVAVAAGLCLAAAVVGGSVVRHLSAPIPSRPS